jgi:hypothetical protein
MAFEFRAEAFNIFNHPQWTGVNNTSCGLEYNSGASDCVNGDAVRRRPQRVSASHPECMSLASENLA